MTLVLFALAFTFSSCVNDFSRGTCDRPDLNKVNLSIGFSSPVVEEKTSLRAESDDENLVNNLYLLIFDANGHRVSYSNDKQIIIPNVSDKVVQENVSLFANMTYTFCLIANVDKEQRLFDNTTLAQLNQIQTYQEYQSYQVNMTLLTAQRINQGRLMTGEKVERLVASTLTHDITIPLTQVSTKVRFVFETAEGIKFKPTGWSVYNLPKRVSLGSTHNNHDLTGADNYFSIEDQPFESVKPKNKGVFNEGATKSFFSFFMLPNSKSTLGDPLAATEYKKRELQVKTPTAEDYPGPGGGKYVKNGAFVHADPYSTYIVVTGDYEGPYNYEGAVSPDSLLANNARYVIHLGYVDNDVNNWEANKNTAYTYKVRINGINEVVTEVVKDDEVNTGVEAHLLRQSDNHFVVDAPFSTAVIHLNGTEYAAAHAAALAGNLAFSCFTPYDNGGQKDYDWVRFIIHRDDEVNKQNPAQSSLIPYPGSASPRLLDINQLIEALKKEYVMIDGKKQTIYYYVTFSVYINEYYYKKKPEWYDFDGDWETDGWRTFVNKPDRHLNIYWDGESSDRLSRDKQSSLSEPKVAITQKAILTPYSLDYDVFEKGQVAVGMEAIQEPASKMRYNNALHFGGATDDKHLWNGVRNMYKALLSGYIGNQSIKMSEYLKIVNDQYVLTGENEHMRDFKAQVECLRMNRDENGNGQIDVEELKWYTPAIYEYTLLGGLGNLSIPVDARLAPRAPYHHFYHYTASTRAGNYRYNKLCYFAEQQLCYNEQIHTGMVRTGRGIGSQSRTFDYVPYVDGSPDYGGDPRLYYRCARRLGVTSDQERNLTPANEPMELLSKKPYIVRVDLDKKSMRPSSMAVTSGPLPFHYDYSVFNRPLREFYVASQTLEGDNNDGYEYSKALKACDSYREMAGGADDGWRLPNAKELQIMLQTLVDPTVSGYPLAGDRLEAYQMGWKNLSGEYNREGSWKTTRCYWSATRFSDDNYVYAITKGILVPQFSLVRTSNLSGFVRCVKDKR